MTVIVCRDAGHPWSAAYGWDQLRLTAAHMDALDATITRSEAKRWRVWIRDQARVEAVMYKPAGATGPWEDDQLTGTPTSACQAIRTGDDVYTVFGGDVTRHTVTERKTRPTTQTGVVLRVSPPVPDSAFLQEDAGKRCVLFNNAWIDAAWFRLTRLD